MAEVVKHSSRFPSSGEMLSDINRKVRGTGRFVRNHWLRLSLDSAAIGSIIGGGIWAWNEYQSNPKVISQTIDNTRTGIGNFWEKILTREDQSISLSGIPQFQPAVSGEYITPATTGKTPEQLAKEAGYKILYRDSNDTTGRTVFYDYRGDWGGGIGEQYNTRAGTDGKTYRSLTSLTGQFVRWENIEGSKDKYIILKNPKTGELFQKIRVDFEGKIYSTEGNQPTVLSVANLSFSNNSEQAHALGINGRLGFIPQWGEEQLEKILHSGDSVSISLTSVKGIGSWHYEDEGNTRTSVTENPFAGSITQRRFGGKAQIEKELASP